VHSAAHSAGDRLGFWLHVSSGDPQPKPENGWPIFKTNPGSQAGLRSFAPEFGSFALEFGSFAPEFGSVEHWHTRTRSRNFKLHRLERLASVSHPGKFGLLQNVHLPIVLKLFTRGDSPRSHLSSTELHGAPAFWAQVLTISSLWGQNAGASQTPFSSAHASWQFCPGWESVQNSSIVDVPLPTSVCVADNTRLDDCVSSTFVLT